MRVNRECRQLSAALYTDPLPSGVRLCAVGTIGLPDYLLWCANSVAARATLLWNDAEAFRGLEPQMKGVDFLSGNPVQTSDMLF